MARCMAMHAASPATAGMLCGGRQPRLRDEDAHIVEGEVLPPVELVKEVAARAELHDQDEVARRDDRAVLVGHEGVRDRGEDACLLHDVLHLRRGRVEPW